MPKNFDNIGCIFCGAEEKIYNELCHNCSAFLDVSGGFIGQKVGNDIELIQYVGRGFYGLTYKSVDQSGMELATKIIPKVLYDVNGKDFNVELSILGRLPNIANIPKFIRAGTEILKINGNSIEIYYIISEWVQGISLKQWLEDYEYTPYEIYQLGRDLLIALEAFNESGFWHNDLHEENILVHELSKSQMRSYGRDIQYIFKVVDIGSAKRILDYDIKEINDYDYIGSHIAWAIDTLNAKNLSLSKQDKYFINMLASFCSKLTDESSHIFFESPSFAIEELDGIWEKSHFTNPIYETKLSDPFDLINALDNPSPKLLKEMYSNTFEYFSRFTASENQSVILCGPRGCGKTMLLRILSYEAIFADFDPTTTTLHDHNNTIGLFISARKEIGNFLVSQRRPLWITNPRAIGYLFNSLIIIKLLDVILELIQREVISDRHFSPIVEFINKSYSLKKENIYTIKNALLNNLLFVKTGDANDVSKNFTEFNTAPAFLDELFNNIRGYVEALSSMTFVILLDDLSLPKIPIEILNSLAPYLFNPGASYKIRISGHSGGIISFGPKGEEFTEGRDFQEINLGYEYYRLSENYDLCLSGFNDILRKRFFLSINEEFTGIQNILGEYDDTKNFGEMIKQYARDKKLSKLNYKGSHVFIKLCSGDISNMLALLKHMYERSENHTTIAIADQNFVIRNYAKSQLKTLKNYKSDHVISLYDTAFNFGMLSRYKLLSNGSENLRIEIDTTGFDDDLLGAVRELLAFGIFISLGFSTNPDGKPVQKLLFRRILTPAFVNLPILVPGVSRDFRGCSSLGRDFEGVGSKRGRSPT